jgi:hypothetical protein
MILAKMTRPFVLSGSVSAARASPSAIHGGVRPAPSGDSSFCLPFWRCAGRAGRFSLHSQDYLDRDARFRISGTGNIEARTDRGQPRQMLPVFGEDIGRNIFLCSAGRAAPQLEEIPWIERATVMRLLPNQIRVRWWSGSRWPLRARGSRSAWWTPTGFC